MSMVQEAGSLKVQHRCRGLKVVKLCSHGDISYSLVQTLLQYDV